LSLPTKVAWSAFAGFVSAGSVGGRRWRFLDVGEIGGMVVIAVIRTKSIVVEWDVVIVLRGVCTGEAIVVVGRIGGAIVVGVVCVVAEKKG
jgi:hypothetical protein